MDPILPSDIKRGTFLVASPEMNGGLFFHGVILICKHTPGSSFGILINKTLNIELPEEILNITKVSNSKIGIRAGGPIQTNQLMLLHTSNDPALEALKITDGVYLGGDLNFLQNSLTEPDGPNVHLCFGYTGWSMGQLEREYLNGTWFLCPATKEYIFDIPPEKLWRTLLCDMGGRYATLSTIPDDLSVN